MKKLICLFAAVLVLAGCEFQGDNAGGGVTVFHFEGCDYLKFGYPENKQAAVHSATCKNVKHTICN